LFGDNEWVGIKSLSLLRWEGSGVGFINLFSLALFKGKGRVRVSSSTYVTLLICDMIIHV
jgi:hypothetical protein